MTKNSEPCGKNNYQRKTKESRKEGIKDLWICIFDNFLRKSAFLSAEIGEK